MKVGDMVKVEVNGGKETSCEIIDIKGDVVIVCGPEEKGLAAAGNRVPIGVGFRRSHIITT